MNSLPKKISNLIDTLTELPGIGPKSAARIVFFLQKAPRELNEELAEAIVEAKLNTKICKICYNLSETDTCQICLSEDREKGKILVIEDPLDLIAIERAGAYKGMYHVLGGVISPMNGIGPDEIRIRELLSRLKGIEQEVELIIATNPNMEGEATAAFLQNEIEEDVNLKKKVKLSRLARGLATGADIDFTDDLTIRKAIEGRIEM